MLFTRYQSHWLVLDIPKHHTKLLAYARPPCSHTPSYPWLHTWASHQHHEVLHIQTVKTISPTSAAAVTVTANSDLAPRHPTANSHTQCSDASVDQDHILAPWPIWLTHKLARSPEPVLCDWSHGPWRRRTSSAQHAVQHQVPCRRAGPSLRSSPTHPHVTGAQNLRAPPSSCVWTHHALPAPNHPNQHGALKHDEHQHSGGQTLLHTQHQRRRGAGGQQLITTTTHKAADT
jgi:hypothetical protein